MPRRWYLRHTCPWYRYGRPYASSRSTVQLDALLPDLNTRGLQLDLILKSYAPGCGCSRSNGSQRDTGLLEITEVQRIGQVARQLIEAILQAIVRLDDMQRRHADARKRTVKKVLLTGDEVRQRGLAEHA